MGIDASHLVALAVATIVLLGSSGARAYDRYNDGCVLCHGDFQNDPYISPTGVVWPASLHAGHNDPSYMASDCALCHTTGGGFNPWLRSSDGTASTYGYGCSGCHGRLDPNAAKGYGLRAQHGLLGVTTCMVCHSGDLDPEPESVAPPYYGLPDTAADVPCNDDVNTSEDFSGDGIGLDNDGDGLIDLQDDDCGTPVCHDEDGDGYGDPGDEICPAGAETDCDDGDDDVYPGAPEIPCDLDDNDCDPITPDSEDADFDGYTECHDCDDDDPGINPGEDEVRCDGVDNDCDPGTADGRDRDDDGSDECEDCDDEDGTVFPGASEDCADGLDNDCDGSVDAEDSDCAGDDDDDDADDDDTMDEFWDEYWKAYFEGQSRGNDCDCDLHGEGGGPWPGLALTLILASLARRRWRR